MADIKKYFVKDSMRFNLDGMRDHVRLIWFAFNNGESNEQVECCGKALRSAEDAQNLIDEIDALLWEGRRGSRVDGKTYGRIKQISDERNWWRFNVNVASGMDEDRATYAFM